MTLPERTIQRGLLVASLVMIGACVEEPSSHLPPPKAVSPAPFELTPPEGFTRLRIGLLPYANPEQIEAAHQPLAQWLAKQLKVPVELVMGDNYDDAHLKLERGEVEMVNLSPYAYVRAEKRIKLRPLVTPIVDGSETAGGYIFVRHDSPRRSLADLKGGSFGFVDPASASGYLFPMKVFADRGLDPKTYFSRTEFLGQHEKLLMAVYEGKIDAGATYQGSMAALKASKNIDPLNFRIIAKTARTPRDLYCVRSDFPAALGDALVKVLVALSAREPHGREILAPLSINGFYPANDRLYDTVRAAAASLELREQ